MTPKTLLLIALATIGMAHATEASAEDFTFTVPVRVSNMPPEITELQVVCGAARTIPRLQGLGGGNSYRTLVGGAFNGTVTVAFNAYPTADPGTATEYSCSLRFLGTVNGVRIVFVRSLEGRMESIDNTAPVVIPEPPNAVQVDIIRGPLP